jgi:hypothetical protein
MRVGSKVEFYPVNAPAKISKGVVKEVNGDILKVQMPTGRVKAINTIEFVIRNYSIIKLVIEFIIKFVNELKPGDRLERKKLKNEIRKAKRQTKAKKQSKKVDE